MTTMSSEAVAAAIESAVKVVFSPAMFAEQYERTSRLVLEDVMKLFRQEAPAIIRQEAECILREEIARRIDVSVAVQP